jgi:hypothetical protein
MASCGSTDDEAPGGLFDDLLRPAEPVPYQPVHTRVLTVPDPEGATIALAVWEAPGSAPALHQALRTRLEAALLATLSRPATDHREDDAWAWLRLAAFDRIPSDHLPALAPFALREVSDLHGGGWRRTLAHVRHEKSTVERELPEDPVTAFQAPIALPAGPPGERLRAWEAALAAETGEELWGEQPGAPFRRLAQLMESAGLGRPNADPAGLHALEAAIVQREAGVIRWIPPLVFQALCDAVAVVASVHHGAPVQWACCEPGPDDLASPPLLRAARDGSHVHIPVGLALLRWCIMPLKEGESPDTLAAWVADQFGA